MNRIRQHVHSFTLVELLVVMAIAALITGMIVAVGPRTSRAQVVQMAAEQVAAQLRRARALAMANRSPYMVSFNIENAPGSSGRVINNRSGGHWCRIGRSGRANVGDNSGSFGDAPPLLTGALKAAEGRQRAVTGLPWDWKATGDNADGAYSGNAPIYPTFAHLVEEIRSGWVSERVTLPAGKARFLALGDSDEGPRLRYQVRLVPSWDCGYGTTYPRPYFGYFSLADKRLYPWGGYDPTLPAVTPVANPAGVIESGASLPGPVSTYSGLFYQGSGEATPVQGCMNTTDRSYDVDWNADGAILGSDAERGAEDDWYLWRSNTPRPLINGDWGDFTIVFNQDGTAMFPAMKCNRRWYRSDNGVNSILQANTPSIWNSGCGACDLAKSWSCYKAASGLWTVPNGESIHYQRHTNRAFITIAPDSLDDRDAFDSPAEAIRTLLPMCRVFVTTAGYVGITPVRWNENVLTELQAQGLGTPWPSDPSIFLMDTPAKRTEIEQNFRYGWLHQLTTSTNVFAPYWTLNPRGTPITDQVSTRMMTDRIWWMKP